MPAFNPTFSVGMQGLREATPPFECLLLVNSVNWAFEDIRPASLCSLSKYAPFQTKAHFSRGTFPSNRRTLPKIHLIFDDVRYKVTEQNNTSIP